MFIALFVIVFAVVVSATFGTCWFAFSRVAPSNRSKVLQSLFIYASVVVVLTMMIRLDITTESTMIRNVVIGGNILLLSAAVIIMNLMMIRAERRRQGPIIKEAKKEMMKPVNY